MQLLLPGQLHYRLVCWSKALKPAHLCLATDLKACPSPNTWPPGLAWPECMSSPGPAVQLSVSLTAGFECLEALLVWQGLGLVF